jgi:hypothetical protein
LENLITISKTDPTKPSIDPSISDDLKLALPWATTPILIDLGADSLSIDLNSDEIYESTSAEGFFHRASEAGTTNFSPSIYRYIIGATAIGAEGEGYESTWGGFTFVILPKSTIDEWSATSDDSGRSGGAGQIFDPTDAGKHLNIASARIEELERWSSTVTLANLVMGDTIYDLDGELGFPNWGNLNFTYDGTWGYYTTVTDWRFYETVGYGF